MPGDDETTLTPAEAFAILGNEHRIAILRAVAAAERDVADASEPYGLSFSELFDRVDLEATSQFAYHLDRLVGSFLRETEDGYRFTAAGERVVRAVLAGTYNEDPSFEPLTVEGRCPACDASTLVASYDTDQLAVTCADCGTRVFSQTLPPSAAVDRSPRDALESGSLRARHDFSLAVQGTCPTCAGVTDAELRTGGTGQHVIACTCRQCGQTVFGPIAFAVLEHPAVVAFYWEHGVNLAERPVWQIVADLLSDRWSSTVTSESPFAASLVVSFGDDELQLTLDETFAVERARTVSTRGGSDDSEAVDENKQIRD
ncbi:DUF7351 domain-containing protein [Halobacterium wangiae]|uniref:DUF7351 domain-containing protein n=1 Tax=Halobacterium wangiae TaxID=2902623 RepID=UPI001E3A1CAE|nr:hypothetical protein [Halobacterium wangiae]